MVPAWHGNRYNAVDASAPSSLTRRMDSLKSLSYKVPQHNCDTFLRLPPSPRPLSDVLF